MLGYLLIVFGICLSVLGVWMIAKNKDTENEAETQSIEQQIVKDTQSPSTTQLVDTVEENSREAITVSPDTTYKEDKRGTEFESHIVDLFGFKQHSKFRELLEWQGDKYSKGVFPKSNCNPDLVIRIGVAGGKSRILGIECKWRYAFVNGTVEWARQDQIDNYKKFGKNRRASVFVALGVGGTESRPDELFIVPLCQMTESIVHRSTLLPYKQKYVDGFLYYNEQRDSLHVLQ